MRNEKSLEKITQYPNWKIGAVLTRKQIQKIMIEACDYWSWATWGRYIGYWRRYPYKYKGIGGEKIAEIEGESKKKLEKENRIYCDGDYTYVWIDGDLIEFSCLERVKDFSKTDEKFVVIDRWNYKAFRLAKKESRKYMKRHPELTEDEIQRISIIATWFSGLEVNKISWKPEEH